MEDLYIPQKLAAEIYYSICSTIGWHNQRRCNDLKLDKKLCTQDWDRRVNLIIFSASFVENYYVFTQYMLYEDNYHALFFALDE